MTLNTVEGSITTYKLNKARAGPSSSARFGSFLKNLIVLIKFLFITIVENATKALFMAS